MNSKTNTTPRFIDLYYEWMEKGELPEDGLCKSIPEELRAIFSMVIPTEEDEVTLMSEGFSGFFWASEEPLDGDDEVRWRRFGELRQSIILFYAAINNEL